VIVPFADTDAMSGLALLQVTVVWAHRWAGESCGEPDRATYDHLWIGRKSQGLRA
jgi:hypothetical protein